MAQNNVNSPSTNDVPSGSQTRGPLVRTAQEETNNFTSASIPVACGTKEVARDAKVMARDTTPARELTEEEVEEDYQKQLSLLAEQNAGLIAERQRN